MASSPPRSGKDTGSVAREPRQVHKATLVVRSGSRFLLLLSNKCVQKYIFVVFILKSSKII